jgi:hypothetical protein
MSKEHVSLHGWRRSSFGRMARRRRPRAGSIHQIAAALLPALGAKP